VAKGRGEFELKSSRPIEKELTHKTLAKGEESLPKDF